MRRCSVQCVVFSSSRAADNLVTVGWSFFAVMVMVVVVIVVVVAHALFAEKALSVHTRYIDSTVLRSVVQ